MLLEQSPRRSVPGERIAHVSVCSDIIGCCQRHLDPFSGVGAKFPRNLFPCKSGRADLKAYETTRDVIEIRSGGVQRYTGRTSASHPRAR